MNNQNPVSNWVSPTKAHEHQYLNPPVPSTVNGDVTPPRASGPQTLVSTPPNGCGRWEDRVCYLTFSPSSLARISIPTPTSTLPRPYKPHANHHPGQGERTSRARGRIRTHPRQFNVGPWEVLAQAKSDHTHTQTSTNYPHPHAHQIQHICANDRKPDSKRR